MPRLQSRPFATPDELRTFPHGHAGVVNVGESAVGRAVYEPGWRWTTAMPPIAGTPTCELHHLGYSISGLMHVVTDDGQELDILPDSIYEIPSGHDAWVVGNEPWVTLEWTSARAFGVPPEGPWRADPRHRPVHRHRRLDGHPAAGGRRRMARHAR